MSEPIGSTDRRLFHSRRFLWQPRLGGVALLLLMVLLVLPIGITILLSLQQNGELEPFAGPFGWQAWLDGFGDSDLRVVLMRSLLLALLVGGSASLLAVAPAYVAAVIGGSWRRIILLISLTALLGDQVTTVMGWSEAGRQLARWLVDPDASSGRYAVGDLMTYLAETHRALPLAVLCQTLAMSRRDPALIEAGIECGATHFRLLRWLVLPLAKPGLILGALLGFAWSLGAFLEPALLNTGSMSLGERLQHGLEVDSNWPQGARLALFMLGLILLALIVSAKLMTLSARPGRPPRRHRLQTSAGGTQGFTFGVRDPLMPIALLCLGFLALPYLWMLALSLRYLYGIAMAAGPILFVQAIIGDPRLLPAIGNSLLTAMMAALLASIAGAGLAGLWRNLLLQAPGGDIGRLPGRCWFWLLLSALPVILPALALSTLHLVTHLFLAIYLPSGLGVIAVALADALRTTPIVAVVLLIFWRQLPVDLDETTSEFALDRQRLKRQVVQATLSPAWPIALLVAFLLSLGDFQLTNALSGDRVLLGPSLLAGIATLRSPIYLALIGPLLGLTTWLSRLILARLDAAPDAPRQARSGHGHASGLGLSMNVTARKS